MNSQKIRNRLFKAGFALPSVMIASLILISVLIVSITGMSALRVALKNQYYGQLAQAAAEAGVEYAKSCLKANNGVATWSGSSLKINTDCRGNETLDCPPSNNNTSCYVVINGNIQTFFTVSAPIIDKDGKAGSIVSNGYAELSRAGGAGQPWRTFSRTAPQLKYTIPLPTISASGSGLNYRADDNYYYYVFTTPGAPTFTVTGGTLVADVLVVGGGGSGGVGAIGSNAGGGGGGGAVVYAANQSLTSGTYTATVGAGGASQTVTSTAGNNGSLSSFVGGSISVSAAGGGGGGASSSTTLSLAAGSNGASGGGGGSSTANGTTSGGTASAGFAGGTGNGSNTVASRAGGGGGGAGSIGAAAATGVGGNAGSGSTTYTSWGTATSGLIGALVSSTYYLGAGGGGGSLGATAGTSTGGTAGTAGNTTATASSSAASNSGAGSGGTNGGASGTGGSGVVALRFARNAINNKVVPTGLSSTNLVLFLDASNKASYPGSGSTWYDLSGNNNNATLFGSPVYSTSNGGILTFSSTSNQYASVNHAASLAFSSTTSMTLIALIKINNLGPNQILAKATNDIPQPYDFYINNTGNVVFRTGDGTSTDTSTSSATLTSGNWAAVAARSIYNSPNNYSNQQNTLRYTASPTGYFFSASNTTLATIARSDGAQALLIGKNNSGSVQLDADVGMIAVYNTSLSFAQMTEVINAFRYRYNI